MGAALAPEPAAQIADDRLCDSTKRSISILSATRSGLGRGVLYRAAYIASARRTDPTSSSTRAVPSSVDQCRPSTWQAAIRGSFRT